METWRSYARFRTLKSFAPYLNRDIVLEDFDFQNRTLRGAEEIRPRWKLGVKLVNGGGRRVARQGLRRAAFPAGGETTRRDDDREPARGVPAVRRLTRLDERTTPRRPPDRNSPPSTRRSVTRMSGAITPALDIVADDLVGNVTASTRIRTLPSHRQALETGRPEPNGA